MQAVSTKKVEEFDQVWTDYQSIYQRWINLPQRKKSIGNG